jgi:hypothetical protein
MTDETITETKLLTYPVCYNHTWKDSQHYQLPRQPFCHLDSSHTKSLHSFCGWHLCLCNTCNIQINILNREDLLVQICNSCSNFGVWRIPLGHETGMHVENEMLQDIQPPCLLNSYVLGLMNFFDQNINKLLSVWSSMLWHHVAWQMCSIIAEKKHSFYHQSRSENGSSNFWNGGSHLRTTQRHSTENHVMNLSLWKFQILCMQDIFTVFFFLFLPLICFQH